MLKDYELVWLRELSRRIDAGLPINRRQMMIDLRAQLPASFKPSDVDGRFLYGTGPSARGLFELGSESQILHDLESTIVHVRDAIVRDPSRSGITDQEISKALGFPLQRAQRLLQIMCTLGHFSAGSSGLPGNEFGTSQVNLSGEDVLAEFLGFDGVEKMLSQTSDSSIPKRVAQSAIQASPLPVEVERDTAFILMNMDPADLSLVDVLSTIKRVCASFEVRAFRIDEVEHQDRITDRVLEMIRAAELLIADLSGERPNVYYEIGFAHAIGKRPILYRKAGTHLHFDLSVHNVPEYTNVTDLAGRLSKRLEAVLGRSAKTPIA